MAHGASATVSIRYLFPGVAEFSGAAQNNYLMLNSFKTVSLFDSLRHRRFDFFVG